MNLITYSQCVCGGARGAIMPLKSTQYVITKYRQITIDSLSLLGDRLPLFTDVLIWAVLFDTAQILSFCSPLLYKHKFSFKKEPFPLQSIPSQ